MLNKIIEFSVRNKLIIGLFVFGLIAYGSYEVTRLPIDAVPDITDNQVQVITVTPSLGAPDVERLITQRSEDPDAMRALAEIALGVGRRIARQGGRFVTVLGGVEL